MYVCQWSGCLGAGFTWLGGRRIPKEILLTRCTPLCYPLCTLRCRYIGFDCVIMKNGDEYDNEK